MYKIKTTAIGLSIAIMLSLSNSNFVLAKSHGGGHSGGSSSSHSQEVHYLPNGKRFVSMAEQNRRSEQMRQAELRQIEKNGEKDRKAFLEANPDLKAIYDDYMRRKEEGEDNEPAEETEEAVEEEVEVEQEAEARPEPKPTIPFNPKNYVFPSFTEKDVVSMLNAKMDKQGNYDNLDFIELVKSGKYFVKYEERKIKDFVSETSPQLTPRQYRSIVDLEVKDKKVKFKLLRDHYSYNLNRYFDQFNVVYANGKGKRAYSWENPYYFPLDKYDLKIVESDRYSFIGDSTPPVKLYGALEDEYVKTWLLPEYNKDSKEDLQKLDGYKEDYKFTYLGSSMKKLDGKVCRCESYKYNFSNSNRETVYEYYYQGSRLVMMHSKKFDNFNNTSLSYTDIWRFIYSYGPIK